MREHERAKAPESSSERSTVLIVEDDADSRFVYEAILADHGFDVAASGSGAEGLRLAQELHPDAVVLDVSIPGMDGWSVTQRLKASPDTSGIPVIIVTAHAFPEDVRRAQSVGCDGFLTKPCEPKRVLEEVLRLVGSPP